MSKYNLLEGSIRRNKKAVIAVSGGIDSLTLAYVAHRILPEGSATMVHAVSPAVPPAATERVKIYAAQNGWQLKIVDANEFKDGKYIENPANRCFFCKSNLYKTLHDLGIGTLMSGTNVDDLSDWRPGLEAAKNYGVVHPFVEAGMSKSDVRTLARQSGLSDIAELPASPCLSSRVETGILIDPKTLAFIDTVEQHVREKLNPDTVRCRVRKDEVVIALDQTALSDLSTSVANELLAEVQKIDHASILSRPVRIGLYKQGDAFIRN